MMCITLKQGFCLALTLLCADAIRTRSSDWFPTPTLIAYEPRGLQISIPRVSGVNLVVVYVNINKVLRSDREVQYVEFIGQETDGKWIFDKDTIKLNVGDVVYFKIYVERNGGGYLYSGTPYLITGKYKLVKYLSEFERYNE